MKTLFITDLDGTLLDDNKQVSSNAQGTIRRLSEQGELFTYATARAHYSAKLVLPWFEANVPAITSSGAFITNNKTGEVLLSNILANEDVENVREVLQHSQASPLSFLSTANGERLVWNSKMQTPLLAKQMMLYGEDKRLSPTDSDAQVYDGTVSKFILIDDEEKLRELHRTLQANPNIRTVLQKESYTGDWWLTIVSEKAGKGNAIRQLKEMLGIDEVVAFGNDKNDIEMFDVADRAYAVGNATDEIKQMATGVIPSNNEDGVTKWLNSNLNINLKGGAIMKYLVVVDIQKDFVDGSLGTKEAQAMIPNAVEKIKNFDGQVIVTYDTHGENYMQTQEGKNLPVPHCIKGTDGWKINDEIEAVLPENAIRIEKPTFGSTKLPEVIRANGTPESIELIGLCTDICVISNALICKANFVETPVSVDSSCCAGVTKESHDKAIATMKMCQVEVTNEPPVIKRAIDTMLERGV